MLTLGNVQENLTLRSLTRNGIHAALVLVLRSPHTTIERAYIPAAEPFLKLLVKALEEAPVKG